MRLWAGSHSWGFQAVSLGLSQPCSSPSGEYPKTTLSALHLPGAPLSSLFLLLALLLPHHLRVSCHIPGLNLSSSRSITPTTAPYPSAHPWGISLLTTLPASFQGSPVLLPCARAPGTAPNCSPQLTECHFLGESDLHNTHGQEGATDGFGNPTTPCSNGFNTENSSVTPRISWQLGRDVPLDLSISTTEGPSRFAAP